MFFSLTGDGANYTFSLKEASGKYQFSQPITESSGKGNRIEAETTMDCENI